MNATITKSSRVPKDYKKGDRVTISGYVNEGGSILAVCALWATEGDDRLVLVPYGDLKIQP